MSEASANGGKVHCPCVAQSPISVFLNSSFCLEPSVSINEVCVERDYGLGCRPWDVGRSPSCDGRTPPPNCSQSWCWVDSQNCSLRQSAWTLVPGGGVYLSYETCGAEGSSGVGGVAVLAIVLLSIAAALIIAVVATAMCGCQREEPQEDGEAAPVTCCSRMQVVWRLR
eukprot:Hpha_TRINITY_DN7356_c0_g1::TRINITY_DN7356_c0_g1_i1::g.9956::m.9956